MMTSGFRIESNQPLSSHLLPVKPVPTLFQDASLAIAVAVKSARRPLGQVVRVVHVPSGEVVFSAGGDAYGSDVPERNDH